MSRTFCAFLATFTTVWLFLKSLDRVLAPSAPAHSFLPSHDNTNFTQSKLRSTRRVTSHLPPVSSRVFHGILVTLFVIGTYFFLVVLPTRRSAHEFDPNGLSLHLNFGVPCFFVVLSQRHFYLLSVSFLSRSTPLTTAPLRRPGFLFMSVLSSNPSLHSCYSFVSCSST